MRTTIASLSPQMAPIATTSMGLATMLQYIPPILGSIATLIGIIASLIIAYKNKQQIKMDAEKHEQWRIEKEREKVTHDLEVRRLKKELE